MTTTASFGSGSDSKQVSTPASVEVLVGAYLRNMGPHQKDAQQIVRKMLGKYRKDFDTYDKVSDARALFSGENKIYRDAETILKTPESRLIEIVSRGC